MFTSICDVLGKRIISFCAVSGRITILFLQTLKRLKDADWHEVVRQMALLGADSLPIVLMTILCTGMVFSVQTAKEFVRLGASSTVGGIVAIAMARVGAGLGRRGRCRTYRRCYCGGAWYYEGDGADRCFACYGC